SIYTFDDGTYLAKVRQYDQAGNADVVQQVVTINAVTPETYLTGWPDDATNRTAQFSFASWQHTSAFQCRVDDGAWAACTNPYYAEGLADGTHTFSVRAVAADDGAVDPTPASATWRVDHVEPAELTIDPVAGTLTSSRPVFTGHGGTAVGDGQVEL